MTGSPAVPSPAPEPNRGLALAVLLGILVLVNLMALLVLVGGQLGQNGPSAPPAVWARALLIAGAAGNLLAIAGLFKSQKWAAFVFMATSIPPVAVNLAMGQQLDRTLLGLVAPVLVVLLLLRDWHRLR